MEVEHACVPVKILLPSMRTPGTALYRERTDKTLYVMGDGVLPYGRIVEAIDIAKGAGVDKVGIVTESMRRAR